MKKPSDYKLLVDNTTKVEDEEFSKILDFYSKSDIDIILIKSEGFLYLKKASLPKNFKDSEFMFFYRSSYVFESNELNPDYLLICFPHTFMTFPFLERLIQYLRLEI
jgi:hypothetical protein